MYSTLNKSSKKLLIIFGTRPEALQSGRVKLVGTQAETIVAEVEQLLSNPILHQSEPPYNPYGNGTTAQQIVAILKQQLGINDERI